MTTSTNLPFLVKFKDIIDKTDLSENSKNNYKYRLERLVNLTNKDIDWVIANCPKTLTILKTKGIKEPQSVKAMINAILTIFKHTKGLKDTKKKAYTCWINHFKEVNQKAEEKYETITPSDKQIEAYVPWPEIIQKRDALDKDSQEYLILSLYTMLPPARADFNKVKIFNNTTPTLEQVKEYPNHLIITTKPTQSMKLVYNEFKTKSQKLQVYEKHLPDNLTQVIKHSLKQSPREFLVVSEKTNEPYHKPNSFTQHVKRVLYKIFNKTMSINTLRHSFVNSVDMNTITPQEKEQLAKEMMHSPEMFDRYRLAIPASQSEDKKAKICEVVCRDA
jgi:hypothetical protein